MVVADRAVRIRDEAWRLGCETKCWCNRLHRLPIVATRPHSSALERCIGECVELLRLTIRNGMAATASGLLVMQLAGWFSAAYPTLKTDGKTG